MGRYRSETGTNRGFPTGTKGLFSCSENRIFEWRWGRKERIGRRDVRAEDENIMGAGYHHRVVLRTDGDETFEDGFSSSEYSTVFRRCLYYIALYCLVDALDGELCIYIGETLSIFLSRK